jgi:hypothetical protein
MKLSRRSMIALSAASLTATGLPRNGASAIPVQKALSADSVVDRIGVNAHFNFQVEGSVWRPEYSSQWLPFIRELGARWYRTGIISNPTAASTGYIRDLYSNNGIRFVYQINPVQSGTTDLTKIAPFLDTIENDLGVETCIGIESINEINYNLSDDYAQKAIDFQVALYDAVRSRPAFDHILLIGPSVWGRSHTAIDYVLTHNSGLGWGPYVDVQSEHLYTGARKPTLCGLPLDSDQTGSDQDMLVSDSISDHLRLVQNQKPVWITEFGYNTLSNPLPGNSLSAQVLTPTAESKYVSRMVLEAVRLGIPRWAIYALLNNLDGKTFYGLKNQNPQAPFTFYNRLAYDTLKRTIALLSDPGPQFEPGVLGYSFSGLQVDGDLHHVLTQKRSGVFHLLAAVDKSSYSRTEYRDVSSYETVTLDLDRRASLIRTWTPHSSGQATLIGKNKSRVSIKIPDHLMDLEITV